MGLATSPIWPMSTQSVCLASRVVTSAGAHRGGFMRACPLGATSSVGEEGGVQMHPNKVLCSFWTNFSLFGLFSVFCWVETPRRQPLSAAEAQTQQSATAAPHNGAQHKATHTGTMCTALRKHGAEEQPGGERSLRSHTCTLEPPKTCCRCLPVFFFFLFFFSFFI